MNLKANLKTKKSLEIYNMKSLKQSSNCHTQFCGNKLSLLGQQLKYEEDMLHVSLSSADVPFRLRRDGMIRRNRTKKNSLVLAIPFHDDL